MVIFVLFTSLLNLLMGSATAKWTVLAPIFIPMFMMLGYSPELTQVAYRIGDSCTNLITPMMSYFAMIVVFARKYDKKAGIGTLVSMMLPYSLFFLIGWTVLHVVWMITAAPRPRSRHPAGVTAAVNPIILSSRAGSPAAFDEARAVILSFVFLRYLL